MIFVLKGTKHDNFFFFFYSTNDEIIKYNDLTFFYVTDVDIITWNTRYFILFFMREPQHRITHVIFNLFIDTNSRLVYIYGLPRSIYKNYKDDS